METDLEMFADLFEGIPDTWRVIPFKDAVHFQEGPGIRNWQYRESGIPFINIRCLVDGRLDRKSMNCLDPDEVSATYSHFLLDAEDYVVSSSGTIGRIAEVFPEDLPCMLNTSVIRMRPSTAELDRRYLKWFLHSHFFQRQIEAFAAGSVQVNYGPSHLKQMFIVMPPLTEQEALADVLGALDDKIELNRKTNETLETMARSLFNASFLEPTESDIPDGWRVGRLGEVLSVIETGGRPEGGVGHITEGVPSVGAESIVGIGRFDFSKTKYVPRAFFDAMKRGHVRDGDVLLYKDGGKPGEFEPHVTMTGNGFPFAEFGINEHVYRLRTDPKLPQSYLYFWLSADATMDEMANRGTGVAIPGLNSTQVRELSVLIPTQTALDKFEQIVAPLICRIFDNCIESRTLSALRDALLPKLLSGAVRVKE